VCGVPSLPPEIPLGHPMVRRRVREPAADVALNVTDAALEESSVLERPQIGTVSSPVSALRLIFLTGFVLSLFLLLMAYIEQNQQTTGIFGFLSIGFFLLLLRTPTHHSVRED
jgi:hypothetical protein